MPCLFKKLGCKIRLTLKSVRAKRERCPNFRKKQGTSQPAGVPAQSERFMMTFYIRSFVLGMLLALPIVFLRTDILSQEPQDFIPVPLDWREVPNAVYDLSGYLDAPAGKDGYIRVEGEQFVNPDGSRFRPWGVNLMANFFFMPKDEAEQVAKDFARFGFTCVRFHSIDAWQSGFLFSNPKNTTEWDAEKLDQFDYFVAQLKKHGIHFTFTLNAYRSFRKEDGVADYDTMGFGKPTYYFDPKVQEQYVDFSRRLLTHKNPYTGTEYRHEPALMWIELLNENSLFEAWAFGRLVPKENNTASIAWKPLTPYYADELCTLWNEWLAKNVSLEQRREWAKALGSGGDRVPQTSGNDWVKCSDEHFAAESRFFFELEKTFFDKMKKFLKEELGVKALITGDADHNDWISQFPHQIAFNMQGDFMGGHGYWEHADYGPPLTLRKHNAMVNDPLDSSYNQFARTPMKGRPFTINETNAFFPHRYAGEHTPILTAYALFQDWDGIHWFNWGNGQRRDAGKRPETLGTSTDAVRFANVIFSGLMFHRGDIEPAKKTVVRTLTRSEALDSLRWNRADHRPFFTKEFALTTPFQHKVLWQLVDDNDPDRQQTYPVKASLRNIESDTGQLIWKNADDKKGVVMMNSPKTQGAIGFIGGTSEQLGDMDIAVENDHAIVLLASLDNKPIREASRLLLLAHSLYKSTGFEWEVEGKTVKNLGTLPTVILPVKGAVKLKNIETAKTVTVTPLTGVGAPTNKSFDAVKSGKDWSVPLGKEFVSTWYLVEIVH